MAKNITVQALGGQPKVIEAASVSDAFQALGLTGNYTASVNGEAANMSDALNDYEFVTFAQAVKGGAKATTKKKAAKKVVKKTK